MKHTIAVLSCTAALVASLTACGGSAEESTLPANTGGSSPSVTTTSAPATTAPTPTRSGPEPLLEHATYNYDGLKVTVNLPADIPTESRPSMRVSSEFLQGVGRTMAENKLDSSVADLASTDVVKYIQTAVVPGSVQGIGSVVFTISNVRTAAGRFTSATYCVDQSRLVQVRKDGSHFLDTDSNGRRSTTVKMSAEINRGMSGTRLARLSSAEGTC